MTTNSAIPAADNSGSIPAYVVKPAGAARGAIIVIQEVFGINPGIRKKTEDWAARGYLAVAPDVFWRQQPGVDLDPDVPEQFQQAIGFMMKHDFDRGLEDLRAVIAWIRRTQGVARVGLVGYCMGGRIAYQVAANTDIDAAVGYYGVGIDQMLDQAGNIRNPLLLHVPTADGFVPPAAQKAMHDGLDAHPKVTIHDYAGLDHGFADTFGARRNEEGARLADERTTEFFARNVG